MSRSDVHQSLIFDQKSSHAALSQPFSPKKKHSSPNMVTSPTMSRRSPCVSGLKEDNSSCAFSSRYQTALLNADECHSAIGATDGGLNSECAKLTDSNVDFSSTSSSLCKNLNNLSSNLKMTNLDPLKQTLTQHEKPMHFLQGIKLNESFNVFDIPSPPSLKKVKRRRQTLSVASVNLGSRTLRDLSSDPTFDNKADRIKKSRVDDIANLKQCKETPMIHSRTDDTSITVPTVPHPLEDGTSTNNTSAFTSSALNKETTESSTSDDGRAAHPVGVPISSPVLSTKSQDKDDSNNNNSIPRKVSNDHVSTTPDHKQNRQTSPSEQKGSIKRSLPDNSALASFGKYHHKKARHRHSTIGITSSTSTMKETLKVNGRRHSFYSPMETRADTITIQEPVFALKESRNDQLTRSFPKSLESDARKTGPLLVDARKLIHLYTKGNNLESQATILQQVNDLTGYVVAPPISDGKTQVSDQTTNPISIVSTRLSIWNRVGPALKQTEKYKKETAAAVEEVTQTRIERLGGTYKYYSLNDGKSKNAINPSDYETRYLNMLDEVSKIRSRFWGSYFKQLQAYSAAVYNSGNDCSVGYLSASSRVTKEGSIHGKKSNTLQSLTAQSVSPSDLPVSMPKSDPMRKSPFSSDDTVTLSELLTMRETMHNNLSKGTIKIHDQTSNSQKNAKSETTNTTNCSVSRVPSCAIVDQSLLRSPLSLDAEAYRAARSRNCEAESGTNSSGASSTDSTDSEFEKSRPLHQKSAAEEDDIEEALLPLPSRDEPSCHPEIAAAEKRLWKELDAALDRYSRTVIEIKKRQNDQCRKQKNQKPLP